jgi:two-component system OmpR family sensor kinase
MSIRARLTIVIAVIFLVTIAVLGFTMVQTTRATLTQQLDDQVMAQAEKRAKGPDPDKYGGKYNGYDNQASPYGPYGTNDYGSETQTGPTASPATNGGWASYEDSGATDGEAWERHDFATLVYAPDGTVLDVVPYGYVLDPQPPPKCPEIPSPELDAILNRVVTLPSTDGSIEYRTYVQQLDNGEIQAVGAPLTDINHAIDDLVTQVAAGGTVAALAATGVSWWFIRRGLQPVDNMVDTAAAIADGDLAARISNPVPGTELGRLGIALNDMLTQIETADAARAASEERLRRFVADAAHELRTPLTSLRGYAELYRQGALPSEQAVGSAMGRIESEGSRMARLVDDLLLLARMDQARGVERRPVDLAQLVSDAVTDFQVVSPQYPVTMAVAPVVVAGDRMRLRQVVDNLLSNVRTHTPTGTAVSIALRREGAVAVLAVRDNGPGVSPEDQEHIFERFWRADKARTRSKGGSGLGLAIVASLVEAHGGSITIASRTGEGTTFTVTLPISGPTPVEPAAEA